MIKAIEIVPYDPKWPEIFAEEAQIIAETLGKNFLEIHHIGSTSVLNLIAKPIIDILVIVDNLIKIKESLALMADIGYESRGEYNIPLRHYFTKKIPHQFHVHVFQQGNCENDSHILFRNYLRNNPDACQEYTQLKRFLISEASVHERNKMGFSNYNLGKDVFIRKILNLSGFKAIGIKHCLHEYEWQEVEKLCPGKIIKKDYANYKHLILSKGTAIIGYIQIEVNVDSQIAIIHDLIIDSEQKLVENLKSQFLILDNNWLEKSELKLISKT